MKEFTAAGGLVSRMGSRTARARLPRCLGTVHAGPETARPRLRALRVLTAVAAAFALTAGCAPFAPSSTGPSQPATQSASTTTPPAAVPAAPGGTAPSSTHAPVPWEDSIRQLAMINAARGWALGAGTVYTTLDGGRTWVASPLPGAQHSGQVAEAAAFLDVSHAWVATAPPAGAPAGAPVSVYRTSDGGKRWQRSVVRAPLLTASVSLTFTDPSHGWLLLSAYPALGLMAKAVFRTADGGATWTMAACGCGKAPAPAPWLSGGMYSTGIGATDARHAWVTGTYHGGDRIPVYATADGGESWSLVQLTLPAPYRNVTYGNAYPPSFSGAGDRDGVLPVELKGPGSPVLALFTSTDGGASWHLAEVLKPEPTCDQGCAIDVLGPQHVWLVDGAGGIYSTSSPDSPQAATVPSPYRLTQVNFVSPRMGWGLARHAQGHTIIVATDDGGVSWKTVQATEGATYRTTPWGGVPIYDAGLAPQSLPSQSPRAAVPVVVVPVKAPFTPKPIAFPQRLTATVPPDLAARVALYAANVGYPLYFLGPHGMTGSGTEGQDGSFAITLGKGAEKLGVFSEGACVGCSVDAAAGLFPAAQREAANYGVRHVITLQDLGAAANYPDAQTALYAYEVAGGERVDGIALYPAFNSVPLLEVSVLTIPADRDLVPWILQSALRVRQSQ